MHYKYSVDGNQLACKVGHHQIDSVLSGLSERVPGVYEDLD